MHRRTLIHGLSAGLLMATITGLNNALALSQGKQKDKQKNKPDKGQKHQQTPSQQTSDGGVDLLVSVSIGVAEARQLAVRNKATGYAALPPGIRKNLARGKPLPPGIAKREVPGAMLQELPSYAGYEWQISGSDLVLVAVTSLIVAEVLEGVFE